MSSSNKYIHTKKGVTLAETLFAAALAAIVLASSILVFIQVVNVSSMIDYDYTATNLAKNRLERARRIIDSRGFDFLPDIAETDTVIDADGTPDAEGEYTRTTAVTTDYNNKERLTRVDVSVHYTRGGQKSKTPVTMTTVFADM